MNTYSNPSVLNFIPQSSVVRLPCTAKAQVDAAPILKLFESRNYAEADEMLCRILEGIALYLDDMQTALTDGQVQAMLRPSERVIQLAQRIGLIEVQTAAGHVHRCVVQNDRVAIEATIARLERGFDLAVSQVWEFRET